MRPSPIQTLRLSLILLAMPLALAACNRDREEPAPAEVATEAGTPALETPAASPSNLTFADKTAHATVALTLPEGIKAEPDLHARTYAEEVRGLRQFEEGALAARTEAEGDEGMPPFEKTVTVTVAGQTDRLFSLRREAFDYSGGAHPNTLTTGIVWDRSLKRVIGAPELFRKGADLTALDQALCTAVNAARRKRVPDARTITLAGRDGWACPRAAETPFVLAPGDQAGKAGGLIFLIGPYQVGPGVEGSYEIAIPQTAFKSMIATAYAGEFAGQPRRTGDVTPR
ncbi:MAG: DUF3298 domain-containing protein [Brevundimonas sp.]|uniref:DUF3298 and DUF4163 domain-containing protein n=1 Tax=Brevundimonas sp. TaxID=1871086 RepID=UPI0030030301